MTNKELFNLGRQGVVFFAGLGFIGKDFGDFGSHELPECRCWLPNRDPATAQLAGGRGLGIRRDRLLPGLRRGFLASDDRGRREARTPNREPRAGGSRAAPPSAHPAAGTGGGGGKPTGPPAEVLQCRRHSTARAAVRSRSAGGRSLDGARYAESLRLVRGRRHRGAVGGGGDYQPGPSPAAARGVAAGSVATRRARKRCSPISTPPARHCARSSSERGAAQAPLHALANCFGTRVVLPYLDRNEGAFASLTLTAPATHMDPRADYGFGERVQIFLSPGERIFATPLKDEYFISEGEWLEWIRNDPYSLREVTAALLEERREAHLEHEQGSAPGRGAASGGAGHPRPDGSQRRHPRKLRRPLPADRRGWSSSTLSTTSTSPSISSPWPGRSKSGFWRTLEIRGDGRAGRVRVGGGRTTVQGQVQTLGRRAA